MSRGLGCKTQTWLKCSVHCTEAHTQCFKQYILSCPIFFTASIFICQRQVLNIEDSILHLNHPSSPPSPPPKVGTWKLIVSHKCHDYKFIILSTCGASTGKPCLFLSSPNNQDMLKQFCYCCLPINVWNTTPVKY